jgi:hypothetical protein
MAGMDMIFDNAIKLLIAKLPPETAERLANVAQIAIDLDGKLDSFAVRLEQIENRQRELLILFQSLVKQLEGKSNVAHNAGNSGGPAHIGHGESGV